MRLSCLVLAVTALAMLFMASPTHAIRILYPDVDADTQAEGSVTPLADAVGAAPLSFPIRLHKDHLDNGHEWIAAFHPTTSQTPHLYDQAVGHLASLDGVDVLRHLSSHPNDVTYEEGRSATSLFRASPDIVRALADQTLADPSADTLQQHITHIEPNLRVQKQLIRNGVDWGLDRLDQRALPLNGQLGQQHTGTNVDAYVIDTGVNTNHQEFGGRAFHFYNYFTSTGPTSPGTYEADGDGHGTHVGSLVGGATVGVAPGVNVYAVRVLDDNGSGSTSTLLAGLNYMHDYSPSNGRRRLAVASLAGPAAGSIASTVQTRVNALHNNRNYIFVAAAGNYPSTLVTGRDACSFVPAAATQAVTTCATSTFDAVESYSFVGGCVNICAPGSLLRGASNTGSGAYEFRSGTSQATPLVGGIIATLYERFPSETNTQIRNRLYANTTTLPTTETIGGSSNSFPLAYLPFNENLPPRAPSESSDTAVVVVLVLGIGAIAAFFAYNQYKQRQMVSGTVNSAAISSSGFTKSAPMTSTSGTTARHQEEGRSSGRSSSKKSSRSGSKKSSGRHSSSHSSSRHKSGSSGYRKKSSKRSRKGDFR